MHKSNSVARSTWCHTNQPFYFYSNSEKWTDLNNLWHTESWRNLTYILWICPPHLNNLAALISNACWFYFKIQRKLRLLNYSFDVATETTVDLLKVGHVRRRLTPISRGHVYQTTLWVCRKVSLNNFSLMKSTQLSCSDVLSRCSCECLSRRIVEKKLKMVWLFLSPDKITTGYGVYKWSKQINKLPPDSVYQKILNSAAFDLVVDK